LTCSRSGATIAASTRRSPLELEVDAMPRLLLLAGDDAELPEVAS
jgi:hypothetical protein